MAGKVGDSKLLTISVCISRIASISVNAARHEVSRLRHPLHPFDLSIGGR